MTTETKTEEKTQTQPQESQQQDLQNATLLFLMETVRELRSEIAKLRETRSEAPATTVTKSSRAGQPRAQGSPHIDTETGIVYKSKASAGKALFPEFEGRQLKDGRTVKMHGWIFHDIVALEPGRLIPYTGSKAHGEVDNEFVLERVETEVEESTKDDEFAGEESEQPKAEEQKAEQPKQPQTQPTQGQQKQTQQKPNQNQLKK